MRFWRPRLSVCCGTNATTTWPLAFTHRQWRRSSSSTPTRSKAMPTLPPNGSPNWGASRILIRKGWQLAAMRSTSKANRFWIKIRLAHQLGDPYFNPEGLATRSHAQYVEGKSLLDMVREDLVAERVAVESYNEIRRYFSR